MNITSVKAKLMAICISFTFTLDNNDICCITVVTDFLITTKKILESHTHPHQCIIILITSKIESFLNKDKYNFIHFWYCPSRVKWPKQ